MSPSYYTVGVVAHVPLGQNIDYIALRSGDYSTTDAPSSVSLMYVVPEIQTAWPINSVYISTTSANPSTTLGFGTWASFGTGQVMVGHDTTQSEFSTLGATGGSKTHTLTAAEMPAHTHIQNPHSHALDVIGGTGIALLGSVAVLGVGSTGTTTASNQSAGGDGSHNNLQPFIVVRFWQRVA